MYSRDFKQQKIFSFRSTNACARAHAFTHAHIDLERVREGLILVNVQKNLKLSLCSSKNRAVKRNGGSWGRAPLIFKIGTSCIKQPASRHGLWPPYKNLLYPHCIRNISRPDCEIKQPGQGFFLIKRLHNRLHENDTHVITSCSWKGT